MSTKQAPVKKTVAKKTTPVPTPAAPRKHGNLKDQDRIFTNLYIDGDVFVEGAIKRVIPLSNLF